MTSAMFESTTTRAPRDPLSRSTRSRTRQAIIIVFGLGQYQPRSDSGVRLPAHELAHTIQQNGSRIMRQPAPAAAAPNYGEECSQGAANPCRQARCIPTQNTTARADFGRAIRYVNAAIQALNAAPLATDTIRALDWFFNSHEPDTANEVKRRLGCIGVCLADTPCSAALRARARRKLRPPQR
jgi:hypothetical protein